MTLEEIANRAREGYIPIIRDNTAQALINVCKEKSPKKILEIGTAIGYSGLLMLQNCQAFLYTIEKDEQRLAEAEKNFKLFGQEARVKLILDDALIALEKLCKDNEKFDLIFLDGAKGQYIKYYPLIKKLLNHDGVLFTDNIYMHGMVKSERKIAHKHRSMVVNLRKYIELLKNDKDFTTNFYDIDDGYSISKLN